MKVYFIARNLIPLLFVVAPCLGCGALGVNLHGASGAKIEDRDEGAYPGLQAAHEGKIVFSNQPIERTGATEAQLVKSTRLDMPL